ncbi:hypothetical protein [Maritimibacter sp. HL-12]|uniref:hypothetical protein n=1 Tax=Maritimibacter sp. HL-12 TaxID=1162418 RepID=UPI000A0F036C|nr:hypothetical protein [Maritimibacter sp. HL-12]SMH32051.1 hypothetical protein SAMN05661107_0308 [Maritimibacter sp. HL-12]
MEIPKPFFYGPLLAAGFGPAQRKDVQLTRIAPGTAAQGAGNEARQYPGQERAAAEARDVAALRREMDRRALPPGPPPAFKLSLLEMDQDLQRVIARVEARRAEASDSAARQPVGAGAATANEATASPEGGAGTPLPGPAWQA